MPAWRRSAPFFLFVLGMLAVSFSVCASDAERWAVEAIDIPNLTSDASIHSMALGWDGCIWLALESELIRYDGRWVRRYDPFFLDFQAGPATRLVAGGSDRIWLKDELGKVLVNESGGWRFWGWPENEKKKASISLMTMTETGEALLIGEEGIRTLSDSPDKIEPLPEGLIFHRLKALHQVGNDCRWYVEADRVLLQEGGASAKDFYVADGEIEASCPGPEGGIFVVDSGKIVWLAQAGEIRQYSVTEEAWCESVTCIVFDAVRKCVWLGTMGDGLWRWGLDGRYAEKIIKSIDPLFVTDLIQMDGRTLWLATSGNGLLCLRSESNRSVPLPQSLQDSQVDLDREETFFAAKGRDVWRMKPGENEFEKVTAQGLHHPGFWIKDGDGGSVLIGDDGMMKMPRRGGRPLMKVWPDELSAAGKVLDACFSGDNAIWLVQERGLVCLNEATLIPVVAWPMEPCGRAELLVTGQAELWMIRDGLLFQAGEGAPPRQIGHKVLQNGFVSIAVAGPYLLALHQSAGLGTVNKDRWLPLNLDLSYGELHQTGRIRSIGGGLVWLTGKDGFVGVNTTDALQAGTDEMPIPSIRLSAVGSDSEVWGIGGEGDSWLWWIHDRELKWVEKRVPIRPLPAKVFLDRIYINGHETGAGRLRQKGLKLNEGDMLLLKFMVSRLADPGKVSLLYRVEGDPGGWKRSSSVGDQILLSYLSPGKYRVLTRINTGDGCWQEPQAHLNFTVSGRSSPWFFILIIVVISAAAGTVLTVAVRTRWKSVARPDSAKYSTSGLSSERAEEIKARLLKLMDTERPYLKASLTLHRLADQMGVHANHLSQVINNNIGLSAKEFINRYRVEAAAERLSDPREHRSIIEIAYESGFYSKSAFNTAFKKIYNVTPSIYRGRKRGAGDG